ncbi:hypothetical protein JX266_002459 [Neoarthrinium moseri]|nr:hypothetical protein JX266_002459 [Neoarthrinium moseri]
MALSYFMPRLCLLITLLAHVAQAWQVPAEYAITASQNNRFFQDSTGQPFFWQADTAWLLFHRLNLTEAELYLSDRSNKGFNIILATAFTQIGINNSNRNGDLPFVDEDVTQPNEPYWAFIDSILEVAWEKGIRVAMVPAWGYYVHSSDNEGSVINTTTARAFGSFIGQRYPYLPKLLVADTNPWWQNKTAVKDNYSRGGVPPEYPHTDWSDVYDELAGGIIDGERESIRAAASWTGAFQKGPSLWWPLMTIHPTNQWFSGGPIALASAFMGDRPWLTFDASQSGHADYAPNPPIPWWNCRRGWEPVQLMYAAGDTGKGRTRPVLDNEPHYENRYNNGKSTKAYWNATDVRIGSWQTVFSGAAGVTYGADNVMQMYIPELYQPSGSGPAISWAEDIHLPGSGQIQYIQKAISDRGGGSYYNRVPAQNIIVSPSGTDDKRVTATVDSLGTWIMVYTPTGDPFSIDIQSLSGCNVEASWYDPLSGKYTAFKHSQCEDTGHIRHFTPPQALEHNDWVLVLDLK